MQNEAINYLTVDEVITIHEAIIKNFGGQDGLIDPGLLESALYRPQTGYYNDLFEMAAALFESLLINHPFVDGNKRVAFFATDVFLRLNGYRFVVEAENTDMFLRSLLDKGQVNIKQISEWIKISAVPL